MREEDRVASCVWPNDVVGSGVVGGDGGLFILRPAWPRVLGPEAVRHPGKGVASDRIEPGRPLNSGGGSGGGGRASNQAGLGGFRGAL